MGKLRQMKRLIAERASGKFVHDPAALQSWYEQHPTAKKWRDLLIACNGNISPPLSGEFIRWARTDEGREALESIELLPNIPKQEA